MISKVDSAYATKAYGRVEEYFYPFLATALHTGGQDHVPIVSHKEKDPPIPNEQEPEWVLEQLWNLRCKEKSPPDVGKRNMFSRLPRPQLDTIPTELTQFDLKV
jgi:hypothetical protein